MHFAGDVMNESSINNSPLVSIVTATFNSERFIEKTYNSILDQSISDWEWIITDDCSTDGTISVLDKICINDARVSYSINHVNSGAAISRNVSLSKCRGKFIAFIDSDDLWHANKLQKQIEFMSTIHDFSFTGYELIDESGDNLNVTVDTKPLEPIVYIDMLKKKATLGCSTVMLRREVFGDIQMPLLRTGQDYALWLKLLRNGATAHLLPEVLMKYRIVKNSISRNKIKKAKRQWQIYRKTEGIDIFRSGVYFIYYAIRALAR